MTVFQVRREDQGVLTVVAHPSRTTGPFTRHLRSIAVREWKEPSEPLLRGARNVFVVSSSLGLPDVKDYVRAANNRHALRALFVRLSSEAEGELLPQLLDRAGLRMVRNMVVHSGMEVPRRVIGAWLAGGQKQLIAQATVVEDRLLVLSCATERFEVPFESMRALARIPGAERSNFEIASDGSYLHWPSVDLHIDLDSIRYATDDDWRRREDLKRAASDKRFGQAIAALRRETGLRQRDVEGLSERQVRRIESGSRPSVTSLEALAKAHSMSLNEYLGSLFT